MFIKSVIKKVLVTLITVSSILGWGGGGGGGVRKWRFLQQKSNACSVGHEKLILFLKPISFTPKDAFLDICILACGWCYQPL